MFHITPPVSHESLNFGHLLNMDWCNSAHSLHHNYLITHVNVDSCHVKGSLETLLAGISLACSYMYRS